MLGECRLWVWQLSGDVQTGRSNCEQPLQIRQIKKYQLCVSLFWRLQLSGALILMASAFGCSYFDSFSFRVLLFWRLQLSGALILAASALCAIILAAPCVLILAALALCSLILAALSALLLRVPLFWRLRVPLFGGSGCPYLAAPCALIIEAQVAYILAASAPGAFILTAWLRVPLFWQLGSRCPYFGGSDWLQNKKI